MCPNFSQVVSIYLYCKSSASEMKVRDCSFGSQREIKPAEESSVVPESLWGGHGLSVWRVGCAAGACVWCSLAVPDLTLEARATKRKALRESTVKLRLKLDLDTICGNGPAAAVSEETPRKNRRRLEFKRKYWFICYYYLFIFEVISRAKGVGCHATLAVNSLEDESNVSSFISHWIKTSIQTQKNDWGNNEK